MASSMNAAQTTALGPRDAMRTGLGTVKADVCAVHPLEPLQKQMARNETDRHREILAASYGQYVPLRMQMESQILSQFRRLPTLPSSMMGLDTLGNRHVELNVGDVFDSSESAEAPKVDLHGTMELRLGMDIGSGSVFHKQK